MRNHFYRVTRSISEDGGRLRFTEIRVAGYRTSSGAERITSCCGKSAPFQNCKTKNAAGKAA